MRSLLVLRALGLGDALTGVPALRGLRRAFPGHRLTLAAPPQIGCWLRDLGLVDDVVPAGPDLSRLAAPAPGIAVNLHGCGPRSHRLLQRLRPGRLIAFRCAEAGFELDSAPVWDPAEHEVTRWCRLVRSAGGECGPQDLRLPVLDRTPLSPGQVVLHPGAASGSRRWPPARWAQVAAELAAGGQPVVLTGGPAETGLCAQVRELTQAIGGPAPADLSDRLSLAELTAVLGHARMLVAGDTGVAHLATALGTPSVLLFGPVAPQRWGPIIDPDRHVVLWRGDPERPGDPHAAAVDPALARIGAEEVLSAARHLGACSQEAGLRW